MRRRIVSNGRSSVPPSCSGRKVAAVLSFCVAPPVVLHPHDFMSAGLRLSRSYQRGSDGQEDPAPATGRLPKIPSCFPGARRIMHDPEPRLNSPSVLEMPTERSCDLPVGGIWVVQGNRRAGQVSRLEPLHLEIRTGLRDARDGEKRITLDLLKPFFCGCLVITHLLRAGRA
jgi:hypothetical protein